MEQVATEWAATNRWPVLRARIANLYGPGQNLTMPQGLISQICRANLLCRPPPVYVPLDTLRDYLYARDCGDLVADSLAMVRAETATRGPSSHVKIVASQRALTIAELLAEVDQVLGRPTQIERIASTSARFQVRDLRLRSIVWPQVDRRPLTPMAEGIRATADHLTHVREVEVRA